MAGENRDKILRKRWLHNIKNEGTVQADKSFYIYAKHFEESCFERDLKLGQKLSFESVP